jgi:hypothetical protein
LSTYNKGQIVTVFRLIQAREIDSPPCHLVTLITD